ncbi:MAG: DegV family protein [Anaerolineae bacterium]|nr:MAG: DegV family protein [Anaerolineae bacterium]
MAKTAFVTDSTAYIPPSQVKQFDINVIPQVLIWDEETLLDGIDIQPTAFYERLKDSKTMPTTSQAPIGTFKEVFEPLVEEGRPVLAILVSDKLSGTIQSAEQAKALFPEATIVTVDSEATAMAMGFQVLAAARAAREGKSFEEVTEIARQAKLRTGVVFVVDTLEFLHRGGRIGGASRLLGTALNLKPILELQDGVIEAVDRVRTRSKAQARLLDLLEERIDGRPNLRLAVLHAAAEERARNLLEVAANRFNPIETVFSDLSPVVGTHVGPGTLGLCYSVES